MAVYDTLRKALDKFGIEHQTLMLCEECGELIQVSNKALRYGIENERDGLIEEMADVLVMIEQLRLFYDINWLEINDIFMQKVDRLERRLKDDT